MNDQDEFRERARRDPRSTAELVAEAMAAASYKDHDDDALSDPYWQPVWILHARTDPSVMAVAARLLASGSVRARALAADILAQVAVGDDARRTRAADLLLPAFGRETANEALISMAFAFGHLGGEGAIPRLVVLSRHPDRSLRHAVAYGLAGSDDASAIAALIVLSGDPDDDVRDWATFALARQTAISTPAMRDALAVRLEDPHDDTRAEALVGLALRGDARVIQPLLRELESDWRERLSDASLIATAADSSVDAAALSGGEAWCPLLVKLIELGLSDVARLRDALRHCGAAPQ